MNQIQFKRIYGVNGWDIIIYIYDNGAGIIHPNEPAQIVFFTKKSYKVVDVVKNVKTDTRNENLMIGKKMMPGYDHDRLYTDIDSLQSDIQHEVDNAFEHGDVDAIVKLIVNGSTDKNVTKTIYDKFKSLSDNNLINRLGDVDISQLIDNNNSTTALAEFNKSMLFMHPKFLSISHDRGVDDLLKGINILIRTAHLDDNNFNRIINILDVSVDHVKETQVLFKVISELMMRVDNDETSNRLFELWINLTNDNMKYCRDVLNDYSKWSDVNKTGMITHHDKLFDIFNKFGFSDIINWAEIISDDLVNVIHTISNMNKPPHKRRPITKKSSLL